MMLVRKRADFIRARQDRYLKIDQGLARPLIHRLFIAAEIEKMNLFDRWGNAVKNVLADKSVSVFDDKVEIMKKDIVKRATTL